MWRVIPGNLLEISPRTRPCVPSEIATGKYGEPAETSTDVVEAYLPASNAVYARQPVT